jgi:hypothetical protein
VAARIESECSVGSFILAPLGEVADEVDFGGFIEEVAEAVFAVRPPLLEQVEGEDVVPEGVGDGDQGDDGVRAVASELVGDAGATAGDDQAGGGEVEEWQAMWSRSSGIRRDLRSACLKSRTRRAGSSGGGGSDFMGGGFGG